MPIDPLFPVDSSEKDAHPQPLFSEDSQAHYPKPDAPQSLFPESQSGSPSPLFVEPDHDSTVSPVLFPEDSPSNSASQPSPEPTLLFDPKDPAPVVSPDLEPDALFDPNEASPPASAPSPVTSSAPLFNPDNPGESLAPKPVPQVTAAFDTPKDPLVEQVLSRILQEYPDRAGQERILRGRMQGFFPLDFDKITDFGESAIHQEQAVVSEGKRSTDLHQSLQVQEQVSRILEEAKGVQKPAGSILGRLKKEVTSFAAHDGPPQWYATLHRLKGSLKLVSTEIPAIMTTGQECQDALTQYALILKAVVPSILDRPLNDAAARRLTILLGALQQVQITLKQLDQSRSLIHTEMQQIDETMTITLPALGFTI